MARRHIAELGLSRVAPRARADGYPRPLLQRDEWSSLDGGWEFAIDPEGTLCSPDQLHFDARIEVPFSPETRRSGIGDSSLYRACWYRRELTAPDHAPDDRIILHFGAVDYDA